MNILVTGAKGMVGTALCNNLKNIKDGKIKQDLALKSMKFMSTILTVQKRNWMSIAQKLILCLILQE